MQCNQCEAVMIQGVYCHETGCPIATYRVECKWCGQEFTQEETGQKFCETSCAESYWG